MMNKFELGADGVGDVPDYLAQEGLELAVIYFEENDLDPAECYFAYKQAPDSELGQAWYAAETEANRVIQGNKKYDNSMIVLVNELA
ncbi:hypothetical protein FJD32_004365 [Shewanella sp. LC6]|uniref:hypothetical protein n=1 Tax=unclassified Shewanella TaxID=196818 RepID=UPI00112D9A13|nr:MULTISPECIES: hypothetical protein [unclassified Shewanella]QQK58810.1 hypothetical protein FJD32_004365 [Shewanella sp. LC6]